MSGQLIHHVVVVVVVIVIIIDLVLLLWCLLWRRPPPLPPQLLPLLLSFLWQLLLSLLLPRRVAVAAAVGDPGARRSAGFMSARKRSLKLEAQHAPSGSLVNENPRREA